MSLKIPFGLLDGQLFGPLEVVNGLKCGCVCPGCGTPLIAKHSQKRQPHFAHHNSEPCSTGFETALHLAAKRVLIETQQILVSPISASVTLRDNDTQTSATVEKWVDGKLISLDSVEQEVRDYEGVIPDIVALVQGKPLFIEIAVTHFVDNAKLEKLQRLGIPVLEIFLKPSSNLPSIDEIKELVVSTKNNRKWLVNPKQDNLRKAARQEALEKLRLAKAKIMEKRSKLREEQERYSQLSDKGKLEEELKLIANQSLGDLLPVIGQRVKGDQIFGVSNEVWQLFLYRKFIHLKQGSSFNTDEAAFELIERFKSQDTTSSDPNLAIYSYLQLLVERGMLEHVRGRMYRVLRSTY